MRVVIISAVFAFSAAVANTTTPQVRSSFVGSSDFGQFVNDKDITSVGADEFVAKNTRFRFTSFAKDSARVDNRMLRKEDIPTLAGLPLVDSVIRFDPSGNELTLIFYSVGDCGQISEVRFDAMVDTLTKKLTESLGKPVAPAASASVVVRAESLSWKCSAGQACLEWSSTRANASRGQAYRAEFIRVVISKQKSATALATKAPRWVPSEQLRGAADGDKWIATVPMVDQGQKGYCAVATSERVFRYFGKDADQHELAEACQTGQGTSADKFEEQMRHIASRFSLRFQVYLSSIDGRFLSDIVKDYVKSGKKKGGVASPPQLEQNPNLLYQFLDSLDPKQFAGVRQADKAGLGRMERCVRECVDRAEPVIWCVHLGIVPEPGLPQARGGHMRLIIGYNSKTEEILYTDSWGRGHELKRMKLADAWAETFGLYVMKPN